MNHNTYILKDKIAIPCGDVSEWSEYMCRADRTVAKTQYENIVISTVFLGVDHNVGDEGEPLLFETMIFEDEDYGHPVSFSLSDKGFSIVGDNKRYSFYGEAEEGHKAICEEIRSRLDKAKEKASNMTYGLVVSEKEDTDLGM